MEVLVTARATFVPPATDANPQINTYNGDIWNNIPFLKLMQGQMSIGDFNKMGTVGTNVYSLQGNANSIAPYLPAPSTNNLSRLNAIRQNPDAWATMDSLYRAGNRDINSEYAMAQAPWLGPTASDAEIRTR